MNIQIFGKNKCFDTKKAERYFKERNIKFQKIDILEKGLSKREYESVCRAVGGWKNLIDENSKAYEKLFMKYISDADQEKKLTENPELFKTPIVRNGSSAAVGYCPDIWKEWK